MLQLSASKDQFALKQRELNISGRCSPFMAKIILMKHGKSVEYNSLWQLMIKGWLKFKTSTPKLPVTKRFLQHINGECACYLILTFLAISSWTSLLERSFSKLLKMCYKDRCGTSSDILDILYLPSTLSVKGDKELWKKTREFL